MMILHICNNKHFMKGKNRKKSQIDKHSQKAMLLEKMALLLWPQLMEPSRVGWGESLHRRVIMADGRRVLRAAGGDG